MLFWLINPVKIAFEYGQKNLVTEALRKYPIPIKCLSGSFLVVGRKKR